MGPIPPAGVHPHWPDQAVPAGPGPGDRGRITEDYQRVKLSRLRPGEQFVYVFDLGDDWAHLCTASTQPIDPVEVLGIVPDQPLPYWGWGDIPDQYGRRWDDDEGESPAPPNAGRTDLPPLRPGWGPDRSRPR